jgi:hypothetical protein
MFEEISGGVAGGLTAAAMMRRRAKRYVRESKAELGLRVIDGAVAGLRDKWLTGFAALSPGRLEFTSYVGGIRIIRRQPVAVAVTAVDMSRRRGAKGMEYMTLNPSCDIVPVWAGTGALELAVPAPYQLEWVLSRLATDGHR